MPEEKLGISIRFVKQYDIAKDTMSPNSSDWVSETAFELAMSDERDIPFFAKLADALKFLVYRVN